MDTKTIISLSEEIEHYRDLLKDKDLNRILGALEKLSIEIENTFIDIYNE